MNQSPRRRGRPSTITADELADVALGLWESRGYAQVPLGAVAEAARVNIRTLHRYFPSKADVVWQELVTSFGGLRAHLDSSPAELSLLSRIRHGIVASLGASEHLDDTRRRLRIISRTPELRTDTSEPFIAWRLMIEDFAREQLGADGEALIPAVLASAVQAATMAALVWWAEHCQGPPDAPVDRALRELEQGFRREGAVQAARWSAGVAP